MWPHHVGIVIAFLEVATQWRMAARGGGGLSSGFGGVIAPIRPIWIGLDYAAVRVALDIEGIEITRELWWGLRIMEDAASALLNKD